MKKMISLMRIDDRLIHGQVAFGWSTSLGINVILVVNDEAKKRSNEGYGIKLS